MKKRNLIIPAIALLLLILDTKNVSEGAHAGIEMCIYSVIPSLFPFMVVTSYLSSSLWGVKSRWLTPVSRILGLPANSGHLYLIGCLGGYPTGAKCIYEAYIHGSISKHTAHRMLAFCCNAGPAFIFGMLQPYFSSKMHLLILWIVHLSSSVATAQFFRPTVQQDCKQSLAITTSLSASLSDSVKAMAKVCGWVLIFKILVQFCQKWIGFILPNALSILLFGVLELTNGCLTLGQVDSEAVRFVFAGFFLAFGGICVLFQTSSVVGDLNIKYYLLGKVIQGAFSVIISSIFIPYIYPEVAENRLPLITISVFAMTLIIILRKYIQKTVAKMLTMEYN